MGCRPVCAADRISFAVVGGAQTDVFAALGAKHVITAGDRQRRRAAVPRPTSSASAPTPQQQAGRPLTIEELVDANVHVRYLESADPAASASWTGPGKAGIRPGKELVAASRSARSRPSSTRSPASSTRSSTSRRWPPRTSPRRSSKHEFRDTRHQPAFRAPAMAPACALPRVYGALLAGRALETRDGRWFAVTQAMAGTAAAPTDAQLTAFMNENAAQLRRPEFRIASVVLFNAAAGAAAADHRRPHRRALQLPQGRACRRPRRRTFVTLTAPTGRRRPHRRRPARRPDRRPPSAEANGGIQPADYDDTPQQRRARPRRRRRRLRPGRRSGLRRRSRAASASPSPRSPPSRRAPPPRWRASRAAIDRRNCATKTPRRAVFAAVEAYEKARTDGKTLDRRRPPKSAPASSNCRPSPRTASCLTASR